MSLATNATSISYQGVLVGELALEGKISNCNISGSYKGTSRSDLRAGGLVGIASGDAKKCSISNCNVNLNMTISLGGTSTSWENVKLYVGGIAGDNQSTIKNCAFKGSITVEASMATSENAKSYIVCVGGLVGANISDASAINTSASKATITVKSKDAKTVSVGASVGSNGSMAPSYASLVNVVSEADIVLEAASDASVSVGGSCGADYRTYINAKKFFLGNQSTIKVYEYKTEEVEGVAVTTAELKEEIDITVIDNTVAFATKLTELEFNATIRDFFA